MLKRIIKLPFRLVFHAYFYLRQFHPIWLFLNREYRYVYKKYPLKMDATQKRVADELKRDGIVITHLDELFPGTELLRTLQSYTTQRRNQSQVGAVKKFLEYLWENIPNLELDNPFMNKAALHPQMLAIVNSYLGMCGQLLHFTLNITKVVDKSSVPVQSQRWHRDPEDKKMCKIFIYLSDVDEGSGPFVYLPQSHYGGKYWRLFPTRPPVGSYPPEGAMEKIFKPENLKFCTGKAGTVVFADTSGLHRGGYATQKERVMFTASFCPLTCPSSYLYSWPKDWQSQLSASPASVHCAIRTKTPLSRYCYDLYRKVIAW